MHNQCDWRHSSSAVQQTKQLCLLHHPWSNYLWNYNWISLLWIRIDFIFSISLLFSIEILSKCWNIARSPLAIFPVLQWSITVHYSGSIVLFFEPQGLSSQDPQTRSKIWNVPALDAGSPGGIYTWKQWRQDSPIWWELRLCRSSGSASQPRLSWVQAILHVCRWWRRVIFLRDHRAGSDWG